MIKTSASISIQYDNPFSPFGGNDYMNGFPLGQRMRV